VSRSVKFRALDRSRAIGHTVFFALVGAMLALAGLLFAYAAHTSSPGVSTPLVSSIILSATGLVIAVLSIWAHFASVSADASYISYKSALRRRRIPVTSITGIDYDLDHTRLPNFIKYATSGAGFNVKIKDLEEAVSHAPLLKKAATTRVVVPVVTVISGPDLVLYPLAVERSIEEIKINDPSSWPSPEQRVATAALLKALKINVPAS